MRLKKKYLRYLIIAILIIIELYLWDEITKYYFNDHYYIIMHR